MLKKIFLVLVAIAFAILVFPSMLPRTVHVERRITIHNSPAAVYAVLADFQQFRSWNPWSAMEPESTSKVEGQGIGAVYSWEGNKVGRGNMVIKDMKENEKIDLILNFEEPFASQAQTGWKLTDLGHGETEVLWYFDQEMSYFQRYLGLTSDGMLGGQFEDGLARLKARLEGKPS